LKQITKHNSQVILEKYKQLYKIKIWRQQQHLLFFKCWGKVVRKFEWTWYILN